MTYYPAGQPEARRVKWTADYRQEVTSSINNHLSPLNELPIGAITAKLVAPLMRTVERNAPDMARKVRQRLRGIFDQAMEEGLILGNPLPTVKRRRAGERSHYPAITDLKGFGQILRDARAADPCKGIQRAHLLLAFASQRVGEVVGAKWEELELDGVDVPLGNTARTKRNDGAGNWSIPRERMKRKEEARGPHVVPLPPALLTALRQWKEDDAGSSEYVCPAPRDPEKPIMATRRPKRTSPDDTSDTMASPRSRRPASARGWPLRRYIFARYRRALSISGRNSLEPAISTSLEK